MNGAMQRQLSIQTFQQLLSWLLHPLPPSRLVTLAIFIIHILLLILSRGRGRSEVGSILTVGDF